MGQFERHNSMAPNLKTNKNKTAQNQTPKIKTFPYSLMHLVNMIQDIRILTKC